ncbi:MAG: hypothetical protein Q9166_005003 [cf. Caloplaca sp. 2 TL-2023]
MADQYEPPPPPYIQRFQGPPPTSSAMNQPTTPPVGNDFPNEASNNASGHGNSNAARGEGAGFPSVHDQGNSEPGQGRVAHTPTRGAHTPSRGGYSHGRGNRGKGSYVSVEAPPSHPISDRENKDEGYAEDQKMFRMVNDLGDEMVRKMSPTHRRTHRDRKIDNNTQEAVEGATDENVSEQEEAGEGRLIQAMRISRLKCKMDYDGMG